MARLRPAEAPDPDIDAVTPAVVIGLDGGSPAQPTSAPPKRNFEVVAGKVLNRDGSQHRFAFCSAMAIQRTSSSPKALVTAGVRTGTPATVLSEVLAMPGCGSFSAKSCPRPHRSSTGGTSAMRFEHALQAARGQGANSRRLWPPSGLCGSPAISRAPSGCSGTVVRVPASSA